MPEILFISNFIEEEQKIFFFSANFLIHLTHAESIRRTESCAQSLCSLDDDVAFHFSLFCSLCIIKFFTEIFFVLIFRRLSWVHRSVVCASSDEIHSQLFGSAIPLESHVELSFRVRFSSSSAFPFLLCVLGRVQTAAGPVAYFYVRTALIFLLLLSLSLSSNSI